MLGPLLGPLLRPLLGPLLRLLLILLRVSTEESWIISGDPELISPLIGGKVSGKEHEMA